MGSGVKRNAYLKYVGHERRWNFISIVWESQSCVCSSPSLLSVKTMASLNSIGHLEHKCDHEENRTKVCAPCGRKISFGKSKPAYFHISDSLEILIKKFLNPSFNSSDSKYPLSICNTCRRALVEHDKSNFERPLPEMPNYEDIILRKVTRTSDNVCNCYVCLTGRFNGHSKVVTGRGHKLQLANKIDISNGMHSFSGNDHLPKKEKKEDTKFSIEICRQCFQEVGRGLNHSCSVSKSSCGSKNFIKMMEKLPEKQQEQVLTTFLKRKASEKNSVNEDIVNPRQEKKLHLSSFGSKMNIILNKKEEQEGGVTLEDLDNFQTNTGMSTNHIKKMANFMRSRYGRNTVEKNLVEHLTVKTNMLEDMFNESEFEFDVENSQKNEEKAKENVNEKVKGKVQEKVKEKIKEKVKCKENRPVIWGDAATLLDAVLKNRNQEPSDVKIKVMADGGGGFFKISMSVMAKFDLQSDSSTKKRQKYSEGGTVGKKSVTSSVKRLILLCVVPKIKETYENVEILVKLIKLNNIPFKFTADFKLMIFLNGQQTASSTYPCPYCFVTLNDLKCSDLTKTVYDNSDPLAISDECLKLKTYGDLKEDFERYKEAGNEKKDAKLFHNTVNLPLFDEEDTTYVIEKCIIPELHILQGFLNHLFWKGLVPLLGEERALLWPTKLNLSHKDYQGKAFEGNACRKMIKNADLLIQDADIFRDVGYFKLVPFVSAFKTMDKIIDCCFSMEQTASDAHLSELLSELSKNYLSTGVSVTLKIHVLLVHLRQCLYFLEKDGLGSWSEQAGESVHQEFLKYWNKYKINLITNSTYSKNLKKAVVEFSSRHL